jgi:preprotein translocase subunit SecB
VHPLLLIECPRLLFPFARALVANATREGGFLPLLIQPIDFLDLYRRQAAAQGGPGAIQPPPPPDAN